MKTRIESLGQRIDLNLLVVFDAIHEFRNLTAAGKALRLSQPAMSHALGRLRSTFKDPLFVRLPRGLQPTPFADEIAPAVIEGLAAIRGTLERKTFDPARSTRVFNIAQGDLAEAVHLPRLAREVQKTAPAVRLHTFEIPGARLRDALGEGEADFTTGDYTLGAGCRESLLYWSDYVCVARADHPTIASRLTLKHFKSLSHILVSPRGPTQHGAIIERALSRRGIAARIAVEVSHFSGVAPLIMSSDMIAIIPDRLAAAMQPFASIKVLPPPIALPKIKISLYWHERFHRDPGNMWLRNIYLRLF